MSYYQVLGVKGVLEAQMDNLVQIKPKNYISRSAVLTFKACDYKGFLTFLFEGHGLSPEKQSLELLIGTVFHRGRQHLLEHCRTHHPDGKFDDQCIDEAVEVARELWVEELGKKSLWLHSGEEARLSDIIAEQECLFEGLIRAWAIRRLPQILEEYDILEVEQEEVFENFSPLVTWLGKADALYKRKSDGAIIVDSAKTASTYPEVTERNILHDMQGISEWVAVEDRLKRWWEDCQRYFSVLQDSISTEIDISNWPSWMQEKWNKDIGTAIQFFHWMISLLEPPKVYAVQYDFALKGQRRKENYDDPAADYVQNSFLCHPWKKDSLVTFNLSGSIGTTGDEYMWLRQPAKGRLPKEWRRINIWEDIGIKTWVEMLARGNVQPQFGDPFLITKDEFGKMTAGVLYTPPLVIRTEFEKAEWLISTKFFAEKIYEYRDIVLEYEFAIQFAESEVELAARIKAYEEHLWRLFPKNTLSCHDFYGKDCQFVVHCHEMLGLQELEQSGYFSVRDPHHEVEKQSFVEKGFLSDE